MTDPTPTRRTPGHRPSLKLPSFLLLLMVVLLASGCATNGLGKEDSERSKWRQQQDIDYGLLPAMDAEQRRKARAQRDDQDMWSYLANRFTLDIPSHPRIARERDFYASNPDYLTLITQRAAPYLHLIVEHLEQNDLPLELALLPIVESAYRPEALSRSQAAGIWQFIPSTGTYMGLEQNHWYDGRRDIVASTEAAARYFNRLRKMFNDDWPIIIAAYNGGEGTLSRAIAANKSAGKPTDFWNLTRISNETANYPARFYALVEIFSQPEKYGFTPESTPVSPAVAQLEFNGPLHLGRLAQLTGIEKEDFMRLNPGYKRLITGPEQRGLLVPREHASRFTDEILAKAGENVSGWGHYIVQRGDSLTSIARRFGTTVAELRQINMLSETVARPGADLLVPLGRPGAIDTLQAQIDAGAQVYRVQRGDSLWAIARRFNTSISQLRSLNALDESSPLRVGQQLVVKAAPAGAVAASNSAGQQAADTYVVQPGDSLWAIARRFSVTVDQIRSWNGIGNRGTLRPGQVLTITSRQPGA